MTTPLRLTLFFFMAYSVALFAERHTGETKATKRNSAGRNKREAAETGPEYRKLIEAIGRANGRIPEPTPIEVTALPECKLTLPNHVSADFEWQDHPEKATVIDLAKPSDSITAVLNVIALTPLGKDVLQILLPKLRAKEIKVFNADGNPKSPLRENEAGVFVVEQKTIWVRQNQPVGQLALTFFHETVHALDEVFHADAAKKDAALEGLAAAALEIDKAVAKRLGNESTGPQPPDYSAHYTKDEKKQHKKLYQKLIAFESAMKFKTERLAFDTEDLFLGEMIGMDACVKKFATVLWEQNLQYLPSNENLIDGYGLDTSSIYHHLGREARRKSKTKKP